MKQQIPYEALQDYWEGRWYRKGVIVFANGEEKDECLQYCNMHNGTPYCKNCDLGYDDDMSAGDGDDSWADDD